MKKFLLVTLCAVMLSLGSALITEHAGASLRSDQKALDLISRARIALGGEAALAEVNNLVIKGRTSVVGENADRSGLPAGETEIAFNLSGEYAKRLSIAGHDTTWVRVAVTGKEADFAALEGNGIEAVKARTVVLNNGDARAVKVGENGEFITQDGEKITLSQVDGTSTATGGVVTDIKEFSSVTAKESGATAIDDTNVKFRAVKGQPIHNNELARVALMLLMTPPQGLDVVYTFVGEDNIDGRSVNTINVELGGSSIKLHLDKFSNLPVAIDYVAPHVKAFAMKMEEGVDVSEMTEKALSSIAVPVAGITQPAQRRVELSDYRLQNGIQLPYKWTTYSGSTVSENFEVSSYEVNSANFTTTTKGIQLMKIAK